MKWGTKIMTGFVTVCVMFLILSVIIAVLLRDVQLMSDELAYDIFPSGIVTNELQYRIERASSLAMQYSLTGNEESKGLGRDEAIAIDRAMEELQEIVNQGREPADKRFLNTLNLLIKSNEALAANISEIPEMLEATRDARAYFGNAHDEMVKYLYDLRKQDRKSQMEAFMVDDITAVELYAGRVIAITTILEYIDRISINMYRGQMYRDAMYFTASLELADAMVERGKWLEGTATTDEGRRQFSEVFTLIKKTVVSVGKLRSAVTASLEHDYARDMMRDEAIQYTNELAEFANYLTYEFLYQTIEAVNTVLMVLVVGLVIALVLSMVLGVIITRSITKSVNLLIETLSDGARQVDNTLGEGGQNAASLEETNATLEELFSMIRHLVKAFKP